jgi:hypothetical protein
LEPALLAAIDAFDSIQRNRRITPELLAPIVEAASSSRGPLFENATRFLGQLTGQFAQACDAVEGMAQNPRSHVRFNAIISLHKSTPLPLTLRILRRGLRDKSARVRAKAADWAGMLRLREIIPDLEEATARERHEETQRTMEFELKLLRDGYILEPGPNDGFNVTTFCRVGITSRWISRSELEQRGVDAVAAEMAAKPDWLSDE